MLGHSFSTARHHPTPGSEGVWGGKVFVIDELTARKGKSLEKIIVTKGGSHFKSHNSKKGQREKYFHISFPPCLNSRLVLKLQLPSAAAEGRK